MKWPAANLSLPSLKYNVAVVDNGFDMSRYDGPYCAQTSRQFNPGVPIIGISRYRDQFPWANASYCKSDDIETFAQIIKLQLSKAKR